MAATDLGPTQSDLSYARSSSIHRLSEILVFIWRRAIGRFLFISHNVQLRTARLGSICATDIVVYNGVEVTPLKLPRRKRRLFSDMFDWSEDCVIFGITGQLDPNKGQEDFIEAAHLAYTLNRKAKFVIGGRGPAQFVQKLQDMVAHRGMSESIKFSGWLTQSIDFYEGIDVLVVASRHDEGFGLVLAEAAERGVPSIATKSGGAVEVIVDSETGILVNKQDPESLAHAMVLLAADEALRDRMGNQARERVVNEFNLAEQTDRFADLLYQSVRPV